MEVKITSNIAAYTILPVALLSSPAFAAEPAAAEGVESRESATLARKAGTTGTPTVDSFSDWLYQGTVYGELKSMMFFKEFGGTVEDKKTFSAGGNLQYRSADFNGFTIGVGGYSAFDLGFNSNNPDKTERYVPGDSVNVIGKAFLRYHHYGFDVSAGRIGLDTPFANGGVGRTMIPALYEGFGGTYALTDDESLKLNMYQIYRFKPYGSDSFGKGDAGAPEIDETSIPSMDTNGFTTAGLRYGRLYQSKAEAWYYNFDKRVQLAYGGLEFPISALKFSEFTPFWGAQYAREWDANNQVNPYDNIDTHLYSGKLGIRSRHHSFYISGTHVPLNKGAFLNGAFFAPYSYSIYDSTPLDVGQPLVSMITSNQPGNAWAGRYAYHNGQALAVLGYTHFDLYDSPGINYPLPAKKMDAGFMILGYNITERLYLELELDYVSSPTKVTRDYHAERLRVVYRFGKVVPENEY